MIVRSIRAPVKQESVEPRASMEEFKFQVDGGKTIDVECERRGKVIVLRTDGREIEVTPEFKGEYLVSLRTAEGSSYAWVGTSGGDVHVVIDGTDYRFKPVRGAARRPVGSGPVAQVLSKSVVSPIPGTVVQIPVSPGERVAQDSILAVVEAMKMEHSVKAPAACLIEAVHAKPGDKVALGDRLMTLSFD